MFPNNFDIEKYYNNELERAKKEQWPKDLNKILLIILAFVVFLLLFVLQVGRISTEDVSSHKKTNANQSQINLSTDVK